jgi:hypothetical protein
MGHRAAIGICLVVLVGSAPADIRGIEPEPAKRGEKALLGRAFYPPAWTLQAYRNAGRYWTSNHGDPPRDYARSFLEYYGLHPAPYQNGEYPMGLRISRGLLGQGISTDCLLCHGGSIAGQSYVGLGNSTLDIQALFADLTAADGQLFKLPFTFCNVRGTSEAGAMAVYLLGWREPDLRLRTTRLELGLRDDLCEDVPAWWLLKKKKTMYYSGGGDARSVRSLMQFMLTPLTLWPAFEREEPTFRDIQAYLLNLEPPRYPFPIDRDLALAGEAIFRRTCARCHGTYGEKWTYPNKIVPLEEIGTDSNRLRGISPAYSAYYDRSWFGHEKQGWLADDYGARLSSGYQAPPLDGLWATAPYLHNGSVPTVYQVLDSTSRPRIFTRSYRTDTAAYDPVRLGWKVTVLQQPPAAGLPARERRKIYDTSLPGRSNAGHTFGDDLTHSERMSVIEYLKTL